MSNKFFISDTHFFHENIIKYCDRPFKDAEEMNEKLVAAWNEHVMPGDKVYHLGDVGMGKDEKKLGDLLGRLNGKKRLIVGNHDNIKSPALHKHFEKIELWKSFPEEGFTITHIPLPLEHLRGKTTVCVHGHLHDKLVRKNGYINVCVEHTNYAPISMDELREQILNMRDFDKTWRAS